MIGFIAGASAFYGYTFQVIINKVFSTKRNGASYTTLYKRMKYKGSRKANSAKRKCVNAFMNERNKLRDKWVMWSDVRSARRTTSVG